MAEKKPTTIVPAQRGMFRDIILRAKLILRLMGDRRVSLWLKLIPIGALIYVISPIDLIMGIPGIDALDDAAVLLIGSTMFLEFCPPDVVKEQMQRLTSNMDIVDGNEEIVDGEATDVTEQK